MVVRARNLHVAESDSSGQQRLISLAKLASLCQGHLCKTYTTCILYNLDRKLDGDISSHFHSVWVNLVYTYPYKNVTLRFLVFWQYQDMGGYGFVRESGD